MAESKAFKVAITKTLGHEGGYSNDPDDAGAETIFGISRRFHPDWEGWRLIDACKDASGKIIRDVHDSNKMIGCVFDFYSANFWDRFQGDFVARVSRNVALEMFDTSVNMGVTRGIIFLQKALNYLNRNERIFSDLIEDGLMGPASLDALRRIKILGDIPVLLKIMNVLQGQHYLDYMSKSPNQEKFCRGWFKRVSF